jgi:hypothetical protein
MKQAVNTTGRTPPSKSIANFITRQAQIDWFKDDVVLATHTSASKSKLANLVTQINHWGGPVSAALYISSEEDIHSLEEFITSINFLPNITTIHVMVEMPHYYGYPHNPLRNLAMEHIGSDYFVALDVDFIPSKDTYPGIVSLLRSNEEFRKELLDHRVFVLPAFEIFPRKGEAFANQDMIPTSKSHLKNMTQEKLANKFHTFFPEGHGPTNFEKWFEEKNGGSNKEDDDKSYYSIKYAKRFEPYILGYSPGIPRYWPHFRGYGNDKVSWFTELDRAGYLFGVLTDFYVVHLNHPSSYSHRTEEIRYNIGNLKHFVEYLDLRYPTLAQ